MTSPPTIAPYSSTCRYCSAPVLWVYTAANERPMPLDPEPDDAGNITLDERGRAVVHGHGLRPLTGGPFYLSHFVTCPNYDPTGPAR